MLGERTRNQQVQNEFLPSQQLVNRRLSGPVLTSRPSFPIATLYEFFRCGINTCVPLLLFQEDCASSLLLGGKQGVQIGWELHLSLRATGRNLVIFFNFYFIFFKKYNSVGSDHSEVSQNETNNPALEILMSATALAHTARREIPIQFPETIGSFIRILLPSSHYNYPPEHKRYGGY